MKHLVSYWIFTREYIKLQKFVRLLSIWKYSLKPNHVLVLCNLYNSKINVFQSASNNFFSSTFACLRVQKILPLNKDAKMGYPLTFFYYVMDHQSIFLKNMKDPPWIFIQFVSCLLPLFIWIFTVCQGIRFWLAFRYASLKCFFKSNKNKEF